MGCSAKNCFSAGRSDFLDSNKTEQVSLSTFVLCEGGTVVADTGAISGGYKNVVSLTTDQVAQRAVGAGAAAGKCLSIAHGFHRIARCICTGSPGHMSSASATHQLAGHVRGRTWLWRGKQININCGV